MGGVPQCPMCQVTHLMTWKNLKRRKHGAGTLGYWDTHIPSSVISHHASADIQTCAPPDSDDGDQGAGGGAVSGPVWGALHLPLFLQQHGVQSLHGGGSSYWQTALPDHGWEAFKIKIA